MKLAKTLLAFGMLMGISNAATITVSAGLTSQGITPLVDGIAPTSFFFAVGSWDSTNQIFSTFGTAQTDSGEVNGQVTATAPASFNGVPIAVFVGTGNSIANSANGGWAVFSAVAGTTFPADVSAATGQSFNMTTPAAVNVLAKGNAASGFVAGGVNTNNFNLVTVPEPSAALLGALGALGLLRRRRA